ncbi:MAG TPA: (d)CMP kinase [Candidatus Binatia bacterium]|nr:(d)CMP kinase [Candidatus Binatia bacterium]
MRRIIVAIDGPSGAGKSTLAKRLAKELGFTYMDTGAMYRALAWKVLRDKTDIANEQELQQLLAQTKIDLSEANGQAYVFLDGIDVTELIRVPEVSQMASKVSTLKPVRRRMLELQQTMGTRGGVVAEGRDIGTVVFPRAEVKIYLDASAAERARRRFEELRKMGKRVTFEETLTELEERDKRDTERDLAPLRKAEDAVVIDSSSLSADTVAKSVMEEIRKKSLEN